MCLKEVVNSLFSLPYDFIFVHLFCNSIQSSPHLWFGKDQNQAPSLMYAWLNMRSSSCRQDHALRVIIIGCSVAGLTLAHALAKRRIDYTILEAHGRLPQPFTGNAFTLLPNGSRILAQLGVWEEIVAASDTIHSHSTFLEDGRLLERIGVERLLSMRYAFLMQLVIGYV